jgi:phenylpropionate dioxygenase-like ring-hydroxylating dioxygenase large terminal subunit
LKANYLLPLEYLADATHITYLHHGLIDTGNVASMPYRLEIIGATVKVYRNFVNEPMPPLVSGSGADHWRCRPLQSTRARAGCRDGMETQKALSAPF